MEKLKKKEFVTKHTIEGFAKRCDCLCGNCPCFGPDKWHVRDQIATNTSKNHKKNKK